MTATVFYDNRVEYNCGMSRSVADAPDSLSCARCNQVKPVSDFSIVTRQGRRCYYSYCKPCHVSYRPSETRKSSRRIAGEAPDQLLCARCKQEKFLSEFAIRTLKGVVRYHSYCKDCENAYARDFRAKDLKTARKKQKAYYDTNRDRILANSRRYRADTREQTKAPETL
jgi:hypothetical protein